MNSLEDPNSLKNIMNEIGLSHIPYKRRLEMAIRIRHFRYLESDMGDKGWNPKTFDKAVTKGVIQRGKGGRFVNKDKSK